MQQILALIVLVMMVYGCGKFVFRGSKSDNTLPPAPPAQVQPVYLYTTEHEDYNGTCKLFGNPKPRIGAYSACRMPGGKRMYKRWLELPD